jgi:hypothetical protein
MFEGQRERARRIVACVNACAGLSTEALESGALRELIDAVERTPADLLFGPTRRAWAKLEGK